jgi:hypothetical protein
VDVFHPTLQVLLAIMTCAVAFLIMKFTAVPIILSLVELSEIQTHAVKGLTSLLSFSLGYWVYVKFYEKRQAVELVFSGRNMLYSSIPPVSG